MKSIFKFAWGYQEDSMNLPVENVDAAIPFYENIMGFQVESRSEQPHKSAVLRRDDVQMALAENGGDPTQDGCFFEVDNVENAWAELKSNGLVNLQPNFQIQRYAHPYKVFFVVAPDGLCYCLGERQ